MKPQQIHTQHAPAPIGPYSQAIQAGNELYCSGQIPLDPRTGELVGGDAATQAERVIENIGAVLCACLLYTSGRSEARTHSCGYRPDRNPRASKCAVPIRLAIRISRSRS